MFEPEPPEMLIEVFLYWLDHPTIPIVKAFYTNRQVSVRRGVTLLPHEMLLWETENRFGRLNGDLIYSTKVERIT